MISTNNLVSCLPKDKHDEEAICRARNVGFPALNPLLPALLEWLQDINWPVAIPIAELLASSGNEIVPHIRKVFDSDDAIWKYWILKALCPNLRSSVLTMLRSDIERLSQSSILDADQEDVRDAAKALLSIMQQ
jgi:hypothetical protein